MTVGRRVISLVIWCVLVGMAGAGDPIISDVALDFKVLAKSLDSDEAWADYQKKLGRIKDRYAAAKTAEKKQSVLEDLEELKVDLVMEDGFPDAWRAILARALKISDEQLTKDAMPEEEVTSLIGSERSRLLEKYFPISKRVEIEQQAIARFPTNNVGDHVTIQVNKRTISGRVNSMSATSAMIGSNSVPMSDLPPSFHTKRMLDKRREYVKENYTDKREEFLKKLNNKLPVKVYRENGYIRYNDNWVPVKDVVAQIETRITELRSQGEAAEDKKNALISKIKRYGIMGAGGFGILVIIGLIIALKARKN